MNFLQIIPLLHSITIEIKEFCDKFSAHVIANVSQLY